MNMHVIKAQKIITADKLANDKDYKLSKIQKKNALELAFDLYGKRGKEKVKNCSTQHELNRALHCLRLEFF